MRLRVSWTYYDNDNESRLAYLDADVAFPTWPVFCPCPACALSRVPFFQFLPTALGTAAAECDGQQPGLSDKDQEFIAAILEVHGVVSVRAEDYRMTIERGLVFDWDEIKPRIECIVAEWALMDPPKPVDRMVTSMAWAWFMKKVLRRKT